MAERTAHGLDHVVHAVRESDANADLYRWAASMLTLDAFIDRFSTPPLM